MEKKVGRPKKTKLAKGATQGPRDNHEGLSYAYAAES
jgi:hypothetical protein